MIPLCGIAIGLAVFIIAITTIWPRNPMPTQKDENDLTNKLNRMALDRNNTKGK